MKQNNNWQWYMSRPNFLTSDECDELVERIKNTEKGEQGCLDDHIGDDHKEYFSGEAALKASGSNNTMNQFENVGALSPKKNPGGRTKA